MNANIIKIDQANGIYSGNFGQTLRQIRDKLIGGIVLMSIDYEYGIFVYAASGELIVINITDTIPHGTCYIEWPSLVQIIIMGICPIIWDHVLTLHEAKSRDNVSLEYHIKLVPTIICSDIELYTLYSACKAADTFISEYVKGVIFNHIYDNIKTNDIMSDIDNCIMTDVFSKQYTLEQRDSEIAVIDSEGTIKKIY